MLALPAIYSLLLPGGFTSHDLTHHVIRLASLDQNLKQGQFPVRWSGELNLGFGYPVFLFNYPLPQMMGEIFHLIGFNLVDSIKIVLGLSLIASALTMFLFLETLLKDKQAAFLGSLFYLYAPIRFIQTYVAATVGASLALVFVPLIFYSMVKLQKGPKLGSILVGSLSLAGLITAHNVTALIFGPVILSFAIWLIYEAKDRGKLIKEYVTMVGLGLGLSAWFWLPAVWEKQYLRYDQVIGRFYADQFPSFQQILYSPWGFGLSHPENPAGGMSYQLGLIHWLVVLLAILGLGFFWRQLKEKKIVIFYLIFFGLSLVLMNKISLPLWDRLPILSLIQFPWRFLALAVFAASILAATLVKNFSFKNGLFLGLLVLVLYANRNHLRINQRTYFTDQYYLNQKTTTATYGEHLPEWGRIATQSAQTKFQFSQGQGEIGYRQDISTEVIAEIQSLESAKVRFNQFYFPGWEIERNGHKVDFNYLESGENYGLPVFELPAGKNIVTAEFKNTLDRTAGDWLSILSWLILGGLVLKLSGGFKKVNFSFFNKR